MLEVMAHEGFLGDFRDRVADGYADIIGIGVRHLQAVRESVRIMIKRMIDSIDRMINRIDPGDLMVWCVIGMMSLLALLGIWQVVFGAPFAETVCCCEQARSGQ